MPTAFQIDDGYTVGQTTVGGFGTVLYCVENLPFAAHHYALVAGADGLPELGAPADLGLGMGAAYVRSRAVVQILNDTTAIYAIRYQQPRLGGSWVRRSSRASTIVEDFKLPKYIKRPAGDYELQDFKFPRTNSRRVESRKWSGSLEQVQGLSAKYGGYLYTLGIASEAIKMVFEGSDVFNDDDGLLRISSSFRTSGPVPAFGLDQGFAEPLPALSYLDQYDVQIDSSGKPVIDVIPANKLYPLGTYSDLPWLTA